MSKVAVITGASGGIGAATAIAVWKKWGGLSQQTVSADPYCLCEREIGRSALPGAPCSRRGGRHLPGGYHPPRRGRRPHRPRRSGIRPPRRPHQ